MTTKEFVTKSDFLAYECTLGAAGMTDKGFFFPVDTAIGKDGKIYVVSRSHEANGPGIRITAMSYHHDYYGAFASVGEGDGQFTWPTSITLDRDGQVYVSDEYNQNISIFDGEGNFLRKWGHEGSSKGQFDGPAGMSFDRKEILYVSDHRNHRIQKYSKNGDYLASFGSFGDGNGQLNLPWGITVNERRGVYVADWRNNRIQRFTLEGEFVATYGTYGDGNGELNRPSSVAVDGDGYMFIADWGNERVQVLDTEGEFVLSLRGEATLSPWGEEFLGSNPDERRARSEADLDSVVNLRSQTPHQISSHIEKYFWSPISIKLDEDEKIYVTERNRHRLQVYRKNSTLG